MQVVNVDQGMSLGPAIYLWTHRLTNIDVVSIVTTTTTPTTLKGIPATMAVLDTITNNNIGWGMDGKVSRVDRQQAHPPTSGSFGQRPGGQEKPELDWYHIRYSRYRPCRMRFRGYMANAGIW